MRRGRAIAALAAAALTAAGCGSAATPAPPFDRAASQSRLQAARALLDVDEHGLGYRVAVAAPRRGVEASTDGGRRRITLFVGAHQAPHLLAHDLAHELGHAVDLERLSAADRRTFLARRGRRGHAWWPAGRADYASGAGDFAEVFALCHAASPVFRSRLAPRPRDPCALLPPAARAVPSRPEEKP